MTARARRKLEKIRRRIARDRASRSNRTKAAGGKYCWAVIFDESAGDFWATKKEFTESDREHLGKLVFFDAQQAAETAKRMNGE